MQVISHCVARHINDDPAIFVGESLFAQMVSRVEQHQIANALLEVHDPLLEFGSDIVAYYRAPNRVRDASQTVSSDRLIQRIDAITKRFSSLHNYSKNDPRFLWTRKEATRRAIPGMSEGEKKPVRLATLDMPGARLIMISMLMAVGIYSKKLIKLMSFEQRYASLYYSNSAHNVFDWVFTALEETGVDLERFFDDMHMLRTVQQVSSKRVSPRQNPAHSM
ncbi:hypothetical protein Q4544_04915 [Cognatishimia sp. 1_MG-2023]|uniref:hypothetical protein n=1 Tax=Cognatishimia sp. 1_MG-2023 TaxID=3062642 RepID=UPI0026E21170|nr:hypothetical protein [Cognatishimia sp. 1_MG-2023]MDO6726270.1 hypothetical protein [Cognatishimia sp. 1_MG-2023]